jgi:transaldolase
MNYQERSDEMSMAYAKLVQMETPTKIHVNNPTIEEAREALAFDVVATTTNPTYVGRLLGLDAEKDAVYKEMDAIIAEESDDDAAMVALEMAMVAKIANLYMPTFEQTGGKRGLVFIQGNPKRDNDFEYRVKEALQFFSIAPNIVVKLPGNFASTKAFRELTAMNKNICITSCLSISQEEEFFKIYRDVHGKANKSPILYVTSLAGILDEFLKKYVAENNIQISEDALDKAGNLFSKLGYKMVQDEKYCGILQGGGARSVKHFTELVGSATESTLNYAFIKKMNEDNPKITNRYQDFYADSVRRELLEKIPWYNHAINRGSMGPEDFDVYPPFVYFRSVFIAAWNKVVDVIARRRRGE